MNLNQLYEPVDYIMEMGGKNVRGLVLKYMQNILKLDDLGDKYINLIIEDINIFHNASLVIDDIQDNSELRRYKPCAHKIYGTPLSINAGYLKCFTLLNRIDDRYPKEIAMSIKNQCIDILEKGHIGQGLDILWPIQKYIPTMEEYIYMIDNKTGIAFTGSIKCLMAIFNTSNDMSFKIGSKNIVVNKNKIIINNNVIELNDAKKELILKLSENIGRFFQIRDDYINLTKPEYWREKGFCEDLDEKKITFIMVLLNQLYPDNNLYTTLHSKNKFSHEEKIGFYKYLYEKEILIKTYFILEDYKNTILNIEKQISNFREPTIFINNFFEKLDYNLPIEPKKIKDVFLINNLCTF